MDESIKDQVDSITSHVGELPGDFMRNLRTITTEFRGRRVIVSFYESDFFEDPTLGDRIQNLVIDILRLEVEDG